MRAVVLDAPGPPEALQIRETRSHPCVAAVAVRARRPLELYGDRAW